MRLTKRYVLRWLAIVTKDLEQTRYELGTRSDLLEAVRWLDVALEAIGKAKALVKDSTSVPY